MIDKDGKKLPFEAVVTIYAMAFIALLFAITTAMILFLIVSGLITIGLFASIKIFFGILGTVFAVHQIANFFIQHEDWWD